MRCSVLIPTCDRRERLGECLSALARQSAGNGTFEVLIGVDGPDGGEGTLASRSLGGVAHEVVVMGKGRGPAATRNALIERARGETLVFLNDDVVPAWDAVSAHMDAQEALRASGKRAMVLGMSPWRVMARDRVVDRLVRETSLIFFYDQMVGDRARDAEHDWGFRHAWTLNLSAPAEAVREIGGFNEDLGSPAYEDLEMAYRLYDRFDAPVLYRPGALVEHVHRYEVRGLLRREIVLGYEGYRLAEVSAACAEAVFGSDLRGEAEVARARAYVEGESLEAERALRALVQIAEKPSDVLDGDPSVVGAVFGLYRAGRVYLRRLGHVAAAEGRTVEEASGWLGRLEPGVLAPAG